MNMRLSHNVPNLGMNIPVLGMLSDCNNPQKTWPWRYSASHYPNHFWLRHRSQAHHGINAPPIYWLTCPPTGSGRTDCFTFTYPRCNSPRYIQSNKISLSCIFFTQFSHSITVTYTRIARVHNRFVETHFPFAANIRVKLFLNCKMGIFFS